MSSTVTNDQHTNLESEIAHLNLAWLYAVRSAARDDVESAMTRFGVDREVASLLSKAHPQSIREMADPAILAFRPRVSNSRLRAYLKGRVNSRAHFLLLAISGDNPDIGDGISGGR